ncbi:radical SAM protein [Hyalangium gracile]|uniref:radical SAM protein n=1 Tax=Hyalangium gracile TaxID=394092 RepID=UPI0021E190F4|nr:radical SAM protein [Hyalangium gracile]
MIPLSRPPDVIWDVTYACPLRCTHCYSESGRRASRQLRHEEMLRVADALISLRPSSVQLSGGEPMLVKGLVQLAERFQQAGISVALYTSGWLMTPEIVPELFRVFSQIHVSVDGATARVHEAIRGRVGGFERAMRALTLLDAAAREERERTGRSVTFGVDCVVVRSNLHQLEAFCTDLVPRFPELKFLFFGVAIPSGLASRQGFAERELLTEEQRQRLMNPDFVGHLRSLVPPSVRIRVSDGMALQMHPEHLARGRAARYSMQVEPDGAVRGMAIYEGTVGSLLEEPAQVLWERVLARPHDPFVAETLSPVRTRQEWAEAVRRIDYHFGTEEVRARIDRRPEFPTPRPPITVLEPAVDWAKTSELPSVEPEHPALEASGLESKLELERPSLT